MVRIRNASITVREPEMVRTCAEDGGWRCFSEPEGSTVVRAPKARLPQKLSCALGFDPILRHILIISMKMQNSVKMLPTDIEHIVSNRPSYSIIIVLFDE